MNLFFCSTPLQIKIALRIIEELELINIVLLFTGILPNRRNEYYLELGKNSKLVDRVIIFDKDKELKKRHSRYLNQSAKKLINKFQLDEVESIYIANINNRFYHHILSVLPSTVSLFTYDDGTENVNKQSKFFRSKRYSFLRKWIQKVNGRRFWLDEVLDKTLCHYTIYENIPNVVERLYYVPLYRSVEFNINNFDKNKKILLGSAYKDVVADRSREKDLLIQITDFIKEHSIDVYLPHPREESQSFVDCEVLIPCQMSEEIVMGYLQQGYSVALYGFGGSSQLNLDQVDHISNYLLDSELISDRVRNGYSLFFNKNRIIPLVS